MLVGMGVGFGFILRGVVRMLMVLVMRMHVGMGRLQMVVVVRMLFRYMEPHAPCHQQRGNDEARTQRIWLNRKRQQRAKEWRHGKVRPGASCP